jgi:alpha-L-fucosidase 2
MKQHPYSAISRRNFLTSAAAVGLLPRSMRAQATGSAPTRPYLLHFAQPASKWPNALPVGNGRLGAMVFGGIAQERIQLNEESIWDGEPNRDRTNPAAAAAIPRIRAALFAGDVTLAEQMATDDLLSMPRRMPCYQTLGDLHLDLTPMGIRADADGTDYRLELDLDTAIATTRYTVGGVTLTREVFSSAPDQVIAVALHASVPHALHLRITLDRPGDHHTSQAAADTLEMTGQALPVNDNPGLPVKEHQTGVRFLTQLHATAIGGTVTAGDAANGPALEVRAATSVLLLLDCATSYRYPAHNGRSSGTDADVLVGDLPAMRRAVVQNIRRAAARPLAQLRARHVADHQRYFRRQQLSFGEDPSAATPTDMRIRAVKQGAEDVHLLPIYFQFGRYMLLCSSRPGTLAANLQGIWNESVDPPWGSKYTVNINAEMNYWFAEAANLVECQLPLFELLATTARSGTQTAQQIYSARGSVVHHNTDIWGDSGPIDGLGGGIWPMGANWLALHAWKHYTFTGDRRLLAGQGYPLLRRCALFLLDYLVRDPATGHLTTGPSCSPENSYRLPNGEVHHLCMGPTMDIAITRSLFARLLQAAAVLEGTPAVTADAALLDKVRAAWQQLPPYQIAPDGRLQEWPHDYAETEPGHRHISHLFGLFPEDQITRETTPELAQAARRALDVRLAHGSGSTGWSRSWIINCMARLGDGEACHANLLELFRQSTRGNLFDVCGLKESSPFQIDGNLGAPAGILEMLLQSHDSTPLTPPAQTSAYTDLTIPLRVLPALPKAWQHGYIRGLRVRGGAEVDLQWTFGQSAQLTLRATSARTYRIVPPPTMKTTQELLRTRPGDSYTLRFS